ncbi:MAG: M15 family metallopeptidase, partial [Nitriliruptor sp.]
RLAAAGIVQGVGGGRYAPAARVPRGQMTVFLVRAHDHVLGASDEPAPDAFTDDDGHQFEPFIDRAAQLGLASGRTATTFAPAERVTRGQTATFAANLLQRSRQDGVMAATTWGFTATVRALPASLRSQMTGSSWHSGRDCPPFDDLRLLEIVHRGFDGRDRVGLMVLHRDATTVVRDALGDAYRSGFRIERMRLIDRYGADDDRSMADNNSSAFNCRTVAGTNRLSEHAYGRALDLNPVQNPYITSGGTVYPPAGAAYRDRSNVRTGMLVRDGATVQAFLTRGWRWGGDWNRSKDYQHLSATGR